jgi:hypothetical protein
VNTVPFYETTRHSIIKLPPALPSNIRQGWNVLQQNAPAYLPYFKMFLKSDKIFGITEQKLPKLLYKDFKNYRLYIEVS